MQLKINNQVKFNIFSFLSTFARSLVEIFIFLYLFKNGYSLQAVVLFYFLVNLFAMPLAYLFVKLGEKTNYIYIMIIGLISFVVVQVLLQNIINTFDYLLCLALLYSIYRRGYWVSRRFYITKIMPVNKVSGLFSIVLVLSQIASILAGYIGAIILSNTNIIILTIISSVILFISVIPLCFIKINKTSHPIRLIENLKKYSKTNYLVFSFYELNNILNFLFPIYIAINVSNTYTLAGNLNAVSNIAIILVIIIYGKVLNKNKNYLILSTILMILCFILKLFILNYFIVIIYFIEGIISKLQNQSVNKIYFENKSDIDLTHYNLIYQLTECFARAMVTLPLLFIVDIKLMIIFVIIVIFILIICYLFKKNR